MAPGQPEPVTMGGMPHRGEHLMVMPFRFSNDVQASTVDEFLDTCEKYPAISRYHLLNSHFEPWLTDLGREDLAKVAESAVAAPGTRTPDMV